MNRFLTLCLLLAVSQCCTVSADYKVPTIAEQAGLAGAVFVAQVKRQYKNRPTEVLIRNASFYKGCGPRSFKISGFSSSAACGIDLPRPKTYLIFFACFRNGRWILSTIDAFAGAVPLTTVNLATLERATIDEFSCFNNDFILTKGCTIADTATNYSA